MKQEYKINRKKFFINIVLPAILAQGLFILLIFAVVIPNFKESLIEAKKEMVNEIINSSLYIAQSNYEDAVLGKISMEEARNLTIKTVEQIRYGTDNKDYIWITDNVPNMIMHPYRKEMNGKNISYFTDPNGKRLFFEMVQKVNSDGEGFVDYMWQWMDDSTRIVPKISYVKEFKEWKWIFGTGVYIEDIRNSIESTVNYLTLTSLGIFALISVLLIIITIRNLKVEKERFFAEISLKESHEKYKALVEASNEGAIMFLNDKCVFINKKIEELIDTVFLENISTDLSDILTDETDTTRNLINSFFESNEESFQLETMIKGKGGIPKNSLLTFSKINFSDSKGFIVIIKDLTFDIENIQNTDKIKEISFNVVNRLNFGIFRTLSSKKGRFTEINSKLLEILGYNSISEISSVNVLELFEDSYEKKDFIKQLNTAGYIRDFRCSVRKKDGTLSNLLINAAVTKGANPNEDCIDGIVFDYSLLKNNILIKEELLKNFIHQSSLWDLPVSAFILEDIPECPSDTSLKDAFKLMEFYGSELLQSSMTENQNYIVSKDKIVKKLSENNISLDDSIDFCVNYHDKILPSETKLIDCFYFMINNNLSYAIINLNGKLKSIYLESLNKLFDSNIKFLSEKIEKTESIEEIVKIHNELPIIVNNLVLAGSDIDIITKTITNVSDKITEVILDKAILQCGTPPSKFSFIALGSEGRSEQGLATDQDNAIIYESDANNQTKEYFTKLASIINQLLNKSGYKLCVGEIMANNPKWNQPISVWKNYFDNWIKTPEPQNIIDSSIFFDFRNIYGDDNLVIDLRNYINDSIRQNPAFLGQMAITTVNYKLPVGIFGKIQTENKEEHSGNFNLKNAIRLLVNIIRLYAMKHSISETNTIKRLENLYFNNCISYSFYQDMKYCFKFLMNIQINYQTTFLMRGTPADNYLDLSLLTTTELNNLKNVLSNISNFQSKVKYDFGVN